MLATPMDVLSQFPVRKTKLQKQAFREAVQSYAESLGYEVTVEEGKHNCRNVIFGDPDQAEFLVTAHYDTPAVSMFPNSIAPTNFLISALKSIPMMAVFFVMAYFGGFSLGKGRVLLGLCLLLIPFFLIFLLRRGPQNQNNANDNTSGVVTVLEIMRSLLPAYREKVCFVLFDMEEAGLIGSAHYRKNHKKATENQLVLNLDCVGDGDEIWFFPSKKLKKDAEKMAGLNRCSGWFGPKCIRIHEKGFSNYPSDHVRFPMSVGIGAFHQKKGLGPWLSRIHTAKDTCLDVTNVNILRACISTLISAS